MKRCETHLAFGWSLNPHVVVQSSSGVFWLNPIGSSEEYPSLSDKVAFFGTES